MFAGHRDPAPRYQATPHSVWAAIRRIPPLGAVRASGEGVLQSRHPVRGEAAECGERLQRLGDERRVEPVRRHVVAEGLLQQHRPDQRVHLLRAGPLRLERGPRPLQRTQQPVVIHQHRAGGACGEDQQRVLRLLGRMGLSRGPLHRGPEVRPRPRRGDERRVRRLVRRAAVPPLPDAPRGLKIHVPSQSGVHAP